MKKLKRISSAAILFCLTGSLAYCSQSEARLQELSQQGKVTVRYHTLGGHSGKCVKAFLANQTNTALKVSFEPGIMLINADPAAQNLMLVHNPPALLKPHQSAELQLVAYCCNSAAGNPGPGKALTTAHKQNDKLLKLGTFLDQNPVQEYHEQTAVWIISNNHSIAGLPFMTTTDTNLLKLVSLCEKLSGQKATWYKINYAFVPGKVFINQPAEFLLAFTFAKKSSGELQIAIFDEKGNLIKTLVAQSSRPAGTYDFRLLLPVCGWKRGRYLLKVFENNEPAMQKEIEV